MCQSAVESFWRGVSQHCGPSHATLSTYHLPKSITPGEAQSYNSYAIDVCFVRHVAMLYVALAASDSLEFSEQHSSTTGRRARAMNGLIAASSFSCHSRKLLRCLLCRAPNTSCCSLPSTKRLAEGQARRVHGWGFYLAIRFFRCFKF